MQFVNRGYFDTQGRLLEVQAVGRDITERKRAEAELRKLEARFRTLVEEIPAVTFMAALDEGVNELYVSPQIESLLGFSQREWLENPVLWYAQLHPDDRERWHREFARTCALGEPFRSVYRFIARDGREVWVHGEAKVVRDEYGRPILLQGVAFDITGMKQAEAELKSLNETLDQQVRERTEIAEARAQELARSNFDLDQFAYIASHDLREPLRTVASYTQRLEKLYAGRLDSVADDCIDRVIKGARLMDRLIDDLYTYSRVGRQGRPAATDCTAVFAAVCGHLKAAIEEAGAVVTSDPLPVVLAIEMELAQVREFRRSAKDLSAISGCLFHYIRVTSSRWRPSREMFFAASASVTLAASENHK
jgi:PAS domain S-box-containing protein